MKKFHLLCILVLISCNSSKLVTNNNCKTWGIYFSGDYHFIVKFGIKASNGIFIHCVDDRSTLNSLIPKFFTIDIYKNKNLFKQHTCINGNYSNEFWEYMRNGLEQGDSIVIHDVVTKKYADQIKHLTLTYVRKEVK